MKAYVEKARVHRVFDTKTGGVGVEVIESRTVREVTYELPATLWFRSRAAFEEAVTGALVERLEVGDEVAASGFVSVRTRDRDGEVVVDLSLNSARLQSVTRPRQDVWGDPAGRWQS